MTRAGQRLTILSRRVRQVRAAPRRGLPPPHHGVDCQAIVCTAGVERVSAAPGMRACHQRRRACMPAPEPRSYDALALGRDAIGSPAIHRLARCASGTETGEAVGSHGSPFGRRTTRIQIAGDAPTVRTASKCYAMILCNTVTTVHAVTIAVTLPAARWPTTPAATASSAITTQRNGRRSAAGLLRSWGGREPGTIDTVVPPIH